MADKKPTVVEKNSAAVDADKEKKKKNKEKEKKRSKMIKFKKYIYQVLKQVHPDIAISSKAVKIINTMVTNIMVKIIHQSSKYINLRRRKSKMLTVREITAAVMEVFPPQMAQLAISAARKALTTYKVNQLTDIMDRTMSLK